jgi:hypothetical protein
MNAMNAAIPPQNTNPLTPSAADATHQRELNTNPAGGSYPTGPLSNNEHHTTHATTGVHTTTGAPHSKMEGIKTALHDMKENVKETLQRDHHHGQDCAKKPQDGKTNPME